VRIVGYCEKCRRIRPVKVARILVSPMRMQTGVCQHCEHKDRVRS
jgi:hypothetical protein